MKLKTADLLNLDDQDSNSDGYISENEDSRARSFQSTRKFSSDAEDMNMDEANDAAEQDAPEIQTYTGEENDDANAVKHTKVSPLTPEEHEKKLRELRRAGVVYFSSIPPYMKPVKLRQILSKFGEVNRIFLNPENATAHSRRVKSGGNRKIKYTEGWAEFRRKSQAVLAARTLNGNPLGGKKGSFYYDDIMNVKYLKHFKWTDLTEQIAIEAQERHEKLKAEIAQATRENRVFIDNLEKKATVDRIRSQRSQKGIAAPPNTSQHEFVQKPAKAPKRTNEDLKNILSKVF